MLPPWLFRLFRNNETQVHELNYLFWECTTRCNLRCRHCGSDCTLQNREKDMPLEHFLRALDTIPAKERPKDFAVVLSGGEPLLRPDIADIGHALRKRGIGWGMVSNGWFYDEAMHQKLMDAGMGALTVSLDGLEASHDAMRGMPGSFQRAVRAIRLFAPQPWLNADVVTCATRRNLRELPQIHALLSDLGVKHWRIFTVLPIGRAAHDPEMMLEAPEFMELMAFIKQVREQGTPPRAAFSCEEYVGAFERHVRDTRFFCHAGVNIASVLIDGRICACPNIDRDRFSQGNIYRDNLWQVWQEKFLPFRDRSWAKTGKCAHCKAWRDCLGGGMHNWRGTSTEVMQCRHASRCSQP